MNSRKLKIHSKTFLAGENITSSPLPHYIVSPATSTISVKFIGISYIYQVSTCFKSWLFSAKIFLVAYTTSKSQVEMFSENLSILPFARTHPGKHIWCWVQFWVMWIHTSHLWKLLTSNKWVTPAEVVCFSWRYGDRKQDRPISGTGFKLMFMKMGFLVLGFTPISILLSKMTTALFRHVIQTSTLS